jgi:hypothetical protein
MLHFIGTHYVELAAAVTIIFMLVLGTISIADAVKHRSG